MTGQLDERDDDDQAVFDMFEEPKGFYQAPKEPTFEEYFLDSGESLKIRLVGHNPLWGHHLWNAGRTLASYLETQASKFIHNRSVLELGAGGGLPSLVAAAVGAKTVVVTDYPDEDLVENLRYNVSTNMQNCRTCSIFVEGYLWGAPAESLLSHIEKSRDQQSDIGTGSSAGFDTLILGDLLFNHSEHGKLIHTVKATLKRAPEAAALVFFTPYRPWLLHKDLAFFDLARDSGLQVDKVFEKVMDKVMFEQDPGDELLRRTVYAYELRWPSTTA